MNLLNTLEHRFARHAIPGLIRLVVALNAVVFFCQQVNPQITAALELDPAAVLSGELWRLVTYIFIPYPCMIFGPWLGMLFYLWFLLIIGAGVERAMGVFRFNLFYLTGMAATTAAAFFFGAAFSNLVLNTSLFLAFAWFYPNYEFYLFFVLPVKVKWLAALHAAWWAWLFLNGGTSVQMAVTVAFLNLALFFGADVFRMTRQRRQVAQRRQKLAAASLPADEPLYRCAVCGRTERTNPELDFRVGADGEDYCGEHLPG